MLEIGQPLLLLAAGGILVPLAIHLWNRRPPRLLATGSIRWFKGSASQSARSLQLKNWPLLLLRCLMLLVFSLLVAGLFWKQPLPESERKVSLFLVEAGLAGGKSQAWVDSLAMEGKEVRLLAPALPPLADSLRWKGKRVDIWGIMKEADTLKSYADTVRIYSPLFQGYFSAERPQLHKQFSFREPSYPQQPREYASGLYQTGDSLLLKVMDYLPERIYFNERIVALGEGEKIADLFPSPFHPFLQVAEEVQAADTFRIRVAASEAYARDAAIVRQAFGLLDRQLPALRLEFVEEGKADLLVWFREEALPQDLQEAGRLVLGLNKNGISGSEWLQLPEAVRPYYLLQQRPLPEQVERGKLARLPIALLELLPAGEEQASASFLHMPLSQARPYQAEREEEERMEETRSLHKWLWIALFGLFAIERIWVLKA